MVTGIFGQSSAYLYESVVTEHECKNYKHTCITIIYNVYVGFLCMFNRSLCYTKYP